MKEKTGLVICTAIDTAWTLFFGVLFIICIRYDFVLLVTAGYKTAVTAARIILGAAFASCFLRATVNLSRLESKIEKEK